jgi:elongation factor P--(R)-beta-lysine ligase
MKTWQRLREHPQLWERYFIREKVIKTIRAYFDADAFHEVETPIVLARPAAESYIEVFETSLLDRFRKEKKAYLSTSPEVALKKLLVAGIGNCYSITKSFRNCEMQSDRHNPEFTILEWYRVGVGYEVLMEDVERLVFSIQQSVSDDPVLHYQGKHIHLSPPWDRLSMKEAFSIHANVQLDEFLDIENARKIAQKKGYTVEPSNTWEELYNQIFLNEIEPKLGHEKPVFLYEFPSSMAALSKKKASDPRYAERFEFYIAGLELGDAYGELTDWREQQRRFDAEVAEIQRLGKTSYEYDHDFIESLKVGLPECSGIAVGVDRLVMLFTNTTNIADTLFFPLSEMFEGQ